MLNRSVGMADNRDVYFKTVEDFRYPQYKEMIINMPIAIVYMYIRIHVCIYSTYVLKNPAPCNTWI